MWTLYWLVPPVNALQFFVQVCFPLLSYHGANLLHPLPAHHLDQHRAACSFVFDDEALEIKKRGEESENVLVGGKNRWPYSTFINWEFWWPAFPVLVYFKVRVCSKLLIAFVYGWCRWC